MASIYFNQTIDMLTAATPSSGGYLLAFDLDGVLKQKDEFGIISEVTGSTPSLSTILGYDNISGPNDIILSENQVLTSATGSAFLSLDDFGDSNIFVLASDSTGQIGFSGYSNGSAVQMFNNQSGGFAYIDSESIQITSQLLLELGTGNGYNVQMIQNSTQSTSSGVASNRSSLYLNTSNSSFDSGIVNSVIVGGLNLSATQSNTVYLGNNVNINNNYTLPNVDGLSGQSLVTDGFGVVTWGVGSPDLENVLTINNNSGSKSIIMGTSTSILSANGGGQIDMDTFGVQNNISITTDNGSFSTSYLLMDESNISISSDLLNISTSTSSITTNNSKGLVYATDYSSTFINNSLVSKLYVDNGTSSIWSQINGVIKGVTAGYGLTGSVIGDGIILDVNLGINSGLTFSGDYIIPELNSDSLEVDINNKIGLKDSIIGDRTFVDSVVIAGDLLVSGTDTYVNVQDLYINDSKITLNATYSSGTPILDSGLIALRGSSQSATLLWNESIDQWQIGLSGSESTIITENGTGLLKNNNKLSVDFGTVSSISYVDSGTASIWSELSNIELQNNFFYIGVNFEVTGVSWTYISPEPFKINTIDNPSSITYSITKNGSPYTLGTNISLYDSMVINGITVIGFLKLNCELL